MTDSEFEAVVYVRYLDHVLFKEVDPSAYAEPFAREAVGWLDYEDTDCIRLVWERLAVPDPHGETRQKATGLVILKSAILEIRRLGEKNYLHSKEHNIYHECKGKNEDWRDPSNAENTPAATPVRQTACWMG
jgi:hypothetical protein